MLDKIQFLLSLQIFRLFVFFGGITLLLRPVRIGAKTDFWGGVCYYGAFF